MPRDTRQADKSRVYTARCLEYLSIGNSLCLAITRYLFDVDREIAASRIERTLARTRARLTPPRCVLSAINVFETDSVLEK